MLPDPGLPGGPTRGETVRVATGKLDQLFLQAEELLAVKLSGAQRLADLRNLAAEFGPWIEAWSELPPALGAQTPAAQALADFLEWNAGFVAGLARRVHTLTAAAAQDQRTLTTLTDTHLADMKTVLMLPFATLLERVPKIVRDLAQAQGKEVEVAIHGGEIEVDRRILEALADPLIHLLRNAVDHGIEPPE